jgi:hypothetical protein
MSGIANGIVGPRGWRRAAVARQSRLYFGPFWAAGLSKLNNSGRQPESLATHRAGRAYYIYVASHDAK